MPTAKSSTAAGGDEVVLRALTVQGGAASQGGCINSTAQLTLDAVTVTGCSATSLGGGVYQKGGSLTLLDGSDVKGNTVTATASAADVVVGGGVYVGGSALIVRASKIESNSVTFTTTSAGLPGSSPYGAGVLADSGSTVSLDGAKLTTK